MTEATVETLAPADDLGAVYDRMMADPVEAPVEETTEEVSQETEAVEAEAVEEAKAEAPVIVPEAPGNLPKAVRDHWAALSDDAREAIARSQGEMVAKLSEQGRLITGIAPIRDVLVQAAKEMPHLAQMAPAQVAEQVMELARIGQRLQAEPAKVIAELAQRYGVTMGENAAPQQGTEALQAKIAQLESHIERISNPEYFRAEAQKALQETTALDVVTQFAASADRWNELEDKVPMFIPAAQAKLGPNASPRDVLQSAYQAAKDYFLPETKAVEAGAKAAPVTPPEKAAEVLKAKSINVAGEASRGRVLSGREELGSVYDRAMRG